MRYPQIGSGRLFASRESRTVCLMPTPSQPLDRDAEFDRLVLKQDYVLTSAQIVANIGRGRLRTALARGQWRRLCRGVIILHSGQPTWKQAVWAALLAAGPGAILAGRAAAHAAGLRLGDPGPLDVLISASRRRPEQPLRFSPDLPAISIHRTVQLPREQVSANNPAMTTPARSLIDAASWAISDSQAQLILFAGCQQRLATAQQIRSIVTGLSRVFRRKLILETLADIEGGVTALSELDFTKLCERYRLPKPELQVKRSDTTGRVRYLDAYWPSWRLQVEIDGAHHMNVLSWEDDMCRQNAVWLAGDRLLRFTARQIRLQPQVVAAQVRAALEAAGWSEVAEAAGRSGATEAAGRSGLAGGERLACPLNT